MRRIAVIGLTTLEYIAVKSIMENSSSLRTEMVNACDMTNDFVDHSDAFIVSADVFANNTEFFLPRKTKTIVICDGFSVVSNNVISIGRSADLIDIIAAMEKFSKEETDLNQSSELTARELEVLKELVKGQTIKEIADKLCISANTAVSHRKNISSKLGIRSISGLSLYAIMNGLA